MACSWINTRYYHFTGIWKLLWDVNVVDSGIQYTSASYHSILCSIWQCLAFIVVNNFNSMSYVDDIFSVFHNCSINTMFIVHDSFALFKSWLYRFLCKIIYYVLYKFIQLWVCETHYVLTVQQQCAYERVVFVHL